MKRILKLGVIYTSINFIMTYSIYRYHKDELYKNLNNNTKLKLKE